MILDVNYRAKGDVDSIERSTECGRQKVKNTAKYGAVEGVSAEVSWFRMQALRREGLRVVKQKITEEKQIVNSTRC